MAVYLAEGIKSASVEAFIKKCAEKSINVRTLQVIRNKKPLVRISADPYDFESPCYLYSLSKSFTSVACGICIDEGLLSLDTKMCELFEDKLPETVTEELSAMTLGDLLSMQSGHAGCVMPQMFTAEDSLKAFFAQPLAKTGEAFVYDTGATCVCAAAAERASGKKLVDFLDEKLFSKLDIKKPVWDECKDGQTFGGTGLYLSSNDIVKFGTMLINKGVYNGQRIVSEEYLSQATTLRSLQNPDESISEWTSGYGYQFWLNTRGGYRGDGAYGQFCFVFPEKDMIAILTGETNDTLSEMTFLLDLLEDMYGSEGDIASLEQTVKSVYKPVPVENGFNDDISFAVEENPSGINRIRFFGESLLHLEMQTDYGKKEIVFGNGEYLLNFVMLKNLCVGLDSRDERRDTMERLSLFAAYESDGEGRLKLTLCHRDKPHTQYWYVDFNKGTVDIKLLTGTIVTTQLKLSPLNRVE